MCGKGMSFGHMNGVLALIALALGYIVCLLAKKEKDILKTAGYIIGIVIIAIASAVVLSKVLLTTKICNKVCPLKQSSMPMTPVPSALPKK